MKIIEKPNGYHVEQIINNITYYERFEKDCGYTPAEILENYENGNFDFDPDYAHFTFNSVQYEVRFFSGPDQYNVYYPEFDYVKNFRVNACSLKQAVFFALKTLSDEI